MVFIDAETVIVKGWATNYFLQKLESSATGEGSEVGTPSRELRSQPPDDSTQQGPPTPGMPPPAFGPGNFSRQSREGSARASRFRRTGDDPSDLNAP